ncbi:DUF5753 domain-containing protein [Saccharothrix lopnurensis]|uniref:DUF5753 domain-containing protein n=1 Tax=Saccharothrix lopnurensis TaxID=1670621 RepID=A0ABW1PGB5_9PSEU
MVEPLDPYGARLEFAKLARRLREAAGFTPGRAEAEMISTIGGYASVLSKVETAQIAPKTAHVTWMLTRYQPSADDAGRLVELADQAAGRAQPVAAGVQSREYLARERRATVIWMIYNEIPGLLQTFDFAFATLAKSPLVDLNDVEALARDREQRGERIFRPDGPEVSIVLGEAALDRMDGGPDIAARQIERLRDIAELERVRFRIIPGSAGAVTGLSNPFTLLHTEPDEWLAFVGHIARNDYIKRDVSRFRLVFDDAWEAAADSGVSEERTRAILEARIADLRQR